MALNVPGDRRFVIVPKHSSLPLAPLHHQQHAGNVIQQQEPYQNNPAQQFQLQRTGTGEYYVYLPYDNLYWAVEGISPNAGAALIQWHDQKTPNQRFRFLYAGDGYYYLRPVHAGGKVLQVPGATHGQDTIKQGELADVKDRNHQLFRVVPASPDYHSNVTPPFQQYSDLLRDAMLGLTGLIPTVGGGAKAVLGVLWPDGHDKDFWNQMTQYVEQRMQAVMEQKKMSDLRKHLAATRAKLVEFLGTPEPDDKLMKLVAAISKSTDDEQDFLEDQEGAKVMPLLMAWGTLVMTLRAEMVQGYDYMHPNKSEEGRRIGKATELGFLKKAIADYQAGVQRARTRALDWRLSFIQQEAEEWKKVEPAGATISTELWHKHWVTDRYDGWRMERSSRRANSGPRTFITHARQAREAQVRAQFEAELDALLGPSYLWPYFDPTKTDKPTNHKKTVAVGTFGGTAGGTAFGLESGDLIEVTLFWNNDRLCGLELIYARWSARYMRKLQQSYTYGSMGNHKAQLQLNQNEYITNVRGYEADQVQGLMLETNHGRLVEGGHLGHATYFEAGLDDAVNARLVGISGSFQNATLNALTFHWEYTLTK